MKPLSSSITVFLYSSSRHLTRRIRISHFSTSSLDSTPSSSHHSSSRRNSDDVRHVRVSVWWDFENCKVPCNVNVYKVTQFITAAVRTVGIKGPVQITAFGDVFQLSRSNQEALSSTGINLTHIPNGGKNSADRSLLVDLMYWVSQNPPPAHLFLISGDRDFASTLHRLRMNNYNILLASTDNAPAVLCGAASIMWQWTSLVSGENLNGKHFNQPPDGPYASWYDHYKVPLEDPYAVCNHVSNRTSCVQSVEVFGSHLKSNHHPIPKLVLDVIRNILKSYPKGLSITELRSELGKSNITIDKNFYGHKKFSTFLMAMPNLLKLQPHRDGQHIIHGVRPKIPETCLATSDTASGPSRTIEGTKDSEDSDPVVAYKEDGYQNADVSPREEISSSSSKLKEAKLSTEDSDPVVTYDKDGSHDASVTPREEISSSSSKLNEVKLYTESKEFPVKQEEPLQVQEQPPTIAMVNEGEDNFGQLYPIQIYRPITEEGTFKSLWRKWSRGNDGHQEKICHTDNDRYTSRKSTDTVTDGNSVDSKDQSPEVGMVSPSSSLATNDAIQDAEISYSEIQEIFTESFWNDMLAFLESSKAALTVLMSKTREQMLQSLRQFGPSQLQSLSENHIIHLVDLLITEKKWIVETPSKTFPFRIVTPSASSFSSKPSMSKDSDSNSQGEKDEIGGSMHHMKNNLPAENQSQIISHCQKLANEAVEEYPRG